jgi:multidrug efflux pump subunit AcrA (membrane-fusion protein)
MEPKHAWRSVLRRLIGLVVIGALALLGWQYLQASTDDRAYVLSGTIEATEIHLASLIGGRVKQVRVAEGDHVQAGQTLINVYAATGNMNEEITAPIDGLVLERLIEPGEIAAPGGTLLVVADLNVLTLAIYVPEDRYGQFALGQTYPVTVDSFPGQTFSGTVSHIADHAEFTPRNVQTKEGRKSTVFAIKLALAPSNGKLKPGMPADVSLTGQ